MLGRTLESLLAIDWPNLDIVVCAGGTDRTAPIAQRYAKNHPDVITWLEQHPGEGKQSALRRAFSRSRGEIIYLTDADCVVSRDTLARLIEPIASGRADATSGTARPIPEQIGNPWVRHQWASAWVEDRSPRGHGLGLLGRNCAVRRDAIEATGAFVEPVATGTDYHLAKMVLSLGYRIEFVPAFVETRYPETVGHYLRQQSRWLRNVVIHGRRFDAQDEVRSVTRTIALGVGILAWPLSWQWTRLPGVALWVFTIGSMTRLRIRRQQALAVAEALAPIARPRLTLSSVVYSVVDLAAWARPAFDLLTSRRRTQW